MRFYSAKVCKHAPKHANTVLTLQVPTLSVTCRNFKNGVLLPSKHSNFSPNDTFEQYPSEIQVVATWNPTCQLSY